MTQSNNNILANVSVHNEGITAGPWGCQQFGIASGDAYNVGGTNWAQSKLVALGMNFHEAKALTAIVADTEVAVR